VGRDEVIWGLDRGRTLLGADSSAKFVIAILDNIVEQLREEVSLVTQFNQNIPIVFMQSIRCKLFENLPLGTVYRLE